MSAAAESAPAAPAPKVKKAAPKAAAKPKAADKPKKSAPHPPRSKDLRKVFDELYAKNKKGVTITTLKKEAGCSTRKAAHFAKAEVCAGRLKLTGKDYRSSLKKVAAQTLKIKKPEKKSTEKKKPKQAKKSPKKSEAAKSAAKKTPAKKTKPKTPKKPAKKTPAKKPLAKKAKKTPAKKSAK